MAPAKARTYAEKARRFASLARFGVERREWDPAISNAVHAAISGLDALCIVRLRRRSASDDHDDAASLLLSIRDLPRKELEAVARHFRSLMRLKFLAEYEDRLCDEADARRALQHLDRLLPPIFGWLGE